MKSKAFIEAYEAYTGTDYAPPGSGAYGQTLRDFTAGWSACHKLLCLCWNLLPDVEHEDIEKIKVAMPYNQEIHPTEKSG